MMDEREHILELVESSEYHQWWGEEEFENFVEQPMRLDQYVLMDEGFATWGFPNEWQVQDYLLENKFPVDGFDGGGGTVWIVDFICLQGKSSIARMMRHIRDHLVQSGHDKALWLRTETGKIGWYKLKESHNG